MFTHKKILSTLKMQYQHNGHLLGAAVGSGSSAKYAVDGGADILLALNAGIYRSSGRGSLAALMPFDNCNRMLMEFGVRELLPLRLNAPLLFGLLATDPTIELKSYIHEIAQCGFHGINNYPTVCIIDGVYREALEQEGISYAMEVEAIRLAAEQDLFTMAFVYDAEQAEQMLEAGADVICVNFGFTRGGTQGAKYVLSLNASVKRANEVFAACDRVRPGVIKMVYGGPINMPQDVQYIYDNTLAMGYVGGSVFERLPSEKAIVGATREYKSIRQVKRDMLVSKMLDGVSKYYSYVEFVKEYVSANYMHEIKFAELADIIHVSRSHLSRLFKDEVGCTFPEFLNNYRINQSVNIMLTEKLTFYEISLRVGYGDYSYFSKIFKRRMGVSPKEFLDQQNAFHYR